MRNHIWTFKSGPSMWCFTFGRGNVLRATTACTFSTSQLPKVLRTWRAFYILTSKCASRHNGVHFFIISTSKSGLSQFFHCWLRNVLRATTACKLSSLISPDGSAPDALASLLFDPPEPQIIGKTQCFATFLPFRAPTSSFLWLFLFSDLLSSSLLFSSLTLPTYAFPSLHIVGSSTSKLPSPSMNGRLSNWAFPRIYQQKLCDMGYWCVFQPRHSNSISLKRIPVKHTFSHTFFCRILTNCMAAYLQVIFS